MRKLSAIEWMFLAVVAICAASIGVLWHVTLDQSHDGAVSRKVLCALRVQTVRHVARSQREIVRAKAFLREHPNGFAGISASVIQASIREDERGVRDDQDALAVLTILHCSPGGTA